MTTDAPWPPDFLDAHGAWMRRLARGLVRDPALAEDLSQETWEAALRHPPRDSARPWLLQVLRNRLRNHLRGEGRRQAREAEVEGDAPATPEEITARLELQRRIGALIAGLDPAVRQLIYERYYEDRAPSEIARRLGIPPGTVRWRLKVTLDELRARLDAEHAGDRRRWVLLLGPPAPPRRSLVQRPRILATGAVLAVGTVAVVMGVRASRARAPASARQAAARLLDPPPVFQAPAALVTRAAAECPEARSLRQEIAIRQAELAPRERPDVEWARSAPNPVAQRRFAPILDEVLGAPGKCPYSLDCRGFICRAQILVARGMRGYGDCYARLNEPTVEFVRRDYLDAWHPSSVHSGRPVLDPVSGLSFSRVDMHYRLATLGGDPLPWAKQPRRVPLAPGRHPARPPLPAARSGACRGEVARLEEQLALLEAKGDLLLRPPEAFAVNEPNPGLAAEVESRLAALTGLTGTPFPLAVECRGPVCLITPRDPTDRSLDVAWRCETIDGQERCPADTEGPGWYARLSRASHHSDFFAFVEFARAPRREEVRSAYVRIRPPSDRDKIDPFVPLCTLEAQVREGRFLERCEGLGGKGTLEFSYTVPGPELEAGPGNRILLDGGGELAGTPAGTCMLRALRDAAAAQDASGTRNGYVIYGRIELPGGLPKYWDRHATRCRDFLPGP